MNIFCFQPQGQTYKSLLLDGFTLPKPSQKSSYVLQDGSRFLACLNEVQEELLHYPIVGVSVGKMLKFLR